MAHFSQHKSRFPISTVLILQVFVFGLTAFVFAGPPNTSLDPGFTAGVAKGDPNINTSVPLADGKTLVGGSFRTTNGLPLAYLVRLNSDGSTDTAFNSGVSGPNGLVYDIVRQTDGKFLIGGAFNSYNGIPRIGIARIDPDGSLDAAFSPAVPGSSNLYINKVAVQSDGKILISGNITNSIRRLNSDGTPDTSFTSPFNYSSGVNDIAVQNDEKIVIGGTFPEGVIRLETDGSVDSLFNPTEAHYAVNAVALLGDGKILIGRVFIAGGTAGPVVKRINPDGSTDNTFLTGAPNGQTDDIAVQTDGKILAAGYSTADGFSILALQRFNGDGSADKLFSIPMANDKGQNVSLQSDGKILLSGQFLSVNGQTRPGIVRLNADGTIDNSFNASFYGNALVQTLIQQPDGKILAAGNFNFANGAPDTVIVRFNADGTKDASFDSGSGISPDPYLGSSSIYDAELQSDGKILISGIFYGYDGYRSTGLVRLNSDGTADTTFESRIFGIGIWVLDVLVLPDGKILAAFLSTDPFTGFGLSGVIRLNSDGSVDNTVDGGIIRKIVRQPDGKILIGGSFVGGGPVQGIKRLNPDGSEDSTFVVGDGFNGTVVDIVVQPDGKILAGGVFSAFNGTLRNRIARLNPDGSLDTAFDPGSGADSIVWKILLDQDGKIVLGGNFSNLNGIGRNRLGRLNPDGSLDISFDSGLDNNSSNTVRALLRQSDGKILIGGYFDSYNGTPRDSLARLLTRPRRALFDFDGDSKTDVSIFRPGRGEWWYLRSSDIGNRAFQFGSSKDKLVPADFTGDGRTDIAVWRESSGEWFILRSEDLSFYSFPFGVSGDIPVPGDYDGDGQSDPAVFRPSNATWYIVNSSGGTTIQSFGLNGDRPVVGDYDGDGKDDIAIFRPPDGSWWLNRSSAGLIVYDFGTGTDKTVPADFTGDGRTDVAFFRPSSNEWFVLRSENASFYSFPFGVSSDIPVPGDYDGDGKADPAVFRPSNNVWYKLQSTNGFEAITFGLTNDVPVPNAFVR